MSGPGRVGKACMLIGEMGVSKRTGKERPKTLILLTRGWRSKWWELICFGPKGHYAKDGSCPHTDALLGQLERPAPGLIRVKPFGDGKYA